MYSGENFRSSISRSASHVRDAVKGKGVHEMDIMKRLGHTNLQMTFRYTHAMPENLRIAVDSLNKHPLPFRPKPAIGIAPKSRQWLLGRRERDL